MQKLPVLSLWRPWTTLILHHGKNVENRTWTTDYRGDLLIAGSVRWDNKMQWPVAAPATVSRGLSRVQSVHPRGIVGVVEVHGMCTEPIGGGTCGCGPWAMPGQAHWQLRNPRPFAEPVPHVGRLKLHQVADDAWPDVERQLKQVTAADPEPIRRCIACGSEDVGVEQEEQGTYLRCYTCGYMEKL